VEDFIMKYWFEPWPV